ncbi:hypothetical protein SI65_06108 [Aspergillus cristatus]|uniref:Uncharacterized protein n=1 Tax=Aspergillus cristatus TaxID=573508 RepID=A0A1E3BBA2_ASPCR|nr:hypothetical protein SI65_06108 [Aspergillus cristatus]
MNVLSNTQSIEQTIESSTESGRRSATVFTIQTIFIRHSSAPAGGRDGPGISPQNARTPREHGLREIEGEWEGNKDGKEDGGGTGEYDISRRQGKSGLWRKKWKAERNEKECGGRLREDGKETEAVVLQRPSSENLDMQYISRILDDNGPGGWQGRAWETTDEHQEYGQ